MTSSDASKVAAKLINERSHDVLVESFGGLLADLGPEQAAVFLADLILTLGADRDRLKERVAALLAARFGRSSEQSSAAQLALFATALRIVAGNSTSQPDDKTSADPAAADGASATEPPTAEQLIEQTNAEIIALEQAQRDNQKKEREARRAAAKLEAAPDGDAVPWPTHLPIREVWLPVPAADRDCLDCGVERKVLRYQTTWRYEYKTTAEVVVIYLPVFACSSHHGGPIQAPVPPKPVDKGQMGFSLAARLIWLRVTHNLPVRRIEEMMLAEGVPVSEQMIHTLLTTSGERAKPLVAAIRAAVQQAALVNLDDTPTVVHDGHLERTRRVARVWLALGDERFAYFFATKSWKATEAEAALGPIRGVLQGDGYKGFPKYAHQNGVTLAGCMAHLRRKFRKALDARDPRAAQPMALIQGMYRVEELARLRRLDHVGRLALRKERTVPMMAQLLAWAKDVQPSIETGSPLGQGWTYLRNNLSPLQVFLTDGIVSIDNLAAERGLRRITIGRKLWLFFRGQTKLEHVCNLMSLASTARMQEVDELAYLAWVLERLATREWSTETARQLLPDTWRAMQEKEPGGGGAGQG